HRHSLLPSPTPFNVVMKTRIVILTAAVVYGCSSAPAPAPAPAPARPTNAGRGAPPPGTPTQPTPGQGQDTSGRGGGPGIPGQPGAPAQPRPYATVIRPGPGTITKRGMFLVHRLNDRVYFEIPTKELNKDELMVGRFARAAAGNQTPGPTTPGFGEYAGDEFTSRTLRWERNGNHVILRSPSFAITADTGNSVYRSVQNSNYGPDIAIFNVDA